MPAQSRFETESWFETLVRLAERLAKGACGFSKPLMQIGFRAAFGLSPAIPAQALHLIAVGKNASHPNARDQGDSKMRRNFSLPRLAIVVAWAAFAPQSRWSELFPTAIAPDMGPTSPNEAGPWMPWNWGYNSSTAAESYLRGSAALTQAAGQYHYNTALGQSLAEDANAKAIANRQSVVDSYYRLKETNAAWQNQARSPRLSPERSCGSAPSGLRRGSAPSSSIR